MSPPIFGPIFAQKWAKNGPKLHVVPPWGRERSAPLGMQAPQKSAFRPIFVGVKGFPYHQLSPLRVVFDQPGRQKGPNFDPFLVKPSKIPILEPKNT